MNDLAIDVACASHRHPPYRMIHKALRLAMTHCLTTLGSVAGEDPGTRLAALAEVEALIALCESHRKHEDRFLHPALRARCPEQVAPFDAEHASQPAAAASLRERVESLRRGGDAGALHALYLALSAYIGHQFTHMVEEETLLTQALWAHFSEAEIAAIEAELVAAIDPAQRSVITEWMLCAGNHQERVALLQALRDALPAAAFEGLLGSLQGRIPSLELGRLRLAVFRMLSGEAA